MVHTHEKQRRSGLLLTASLAAVLLPVMATLSHAQVKAEAAPATTVEAAAAEAGSGESLLELVLKSGVTGWAFLGVLALFSLFAATIAIERAVNTRREQIVPGPLTEGLRDISRSPDSTLLQLEALSRSSRSPLATVLDAGLLRAGRPLLEVEKAMEDAAAREMAEVRSRIRPLSVIGSIAPLVGLLGTVLGMIVAFRTASEAGLGKGELMAQGIYLALLTTAAGLLIAIPCLMLAAYFHGKVERFFREIDGQLMQVLPVFAGMEQLSPVMRREPPGDDGAGEVAAEDRPQPARPELAAAAAKG